MSEGPEYTRYRQDAAVLAEIGRRLDPQIGRIRVRLPRDLAASAVAAWDRDELGELGQESHEQRALRGQAGALALIGLAISTRGVASGDDVVIELDVTEIAAALTANHEKPRDTSTASSD